MLNGTMVINPIKKGMPILFQRFLMNACSPDLK